MMALPIYDLILKEENRGVRLEAMQEGKRNNNTTCVW